jgi:hypothetical protein
VRLGFGLVPGCRHLLRRFWTAGVRAERLAEENPETSFSRHNEISQVDGEVAF